MDDKAWMLLMKELDDIKEDIKYIKKEISGLKIKMASIASVFGVIGAFIKTKFFH